MMSLAAADRNALLELKTGMLSDALDSLGLAGGCAGLRPLSSHIRMVWTALTLRYLPRGTTDGTVDEFLHLADPGNVIVIDNRGRLDCTVWGEILSTVAHQNMILQMTVYQLSLSVLNKVYRYDRVRFEYGTEAVGVAECLMCFSKLSPLARLCAANTWGNQMRC